MSVNHTVMNSNYDWHGRDLQTALNEEPSLSLDFYSYGVMLRKHEGDAVTEYAVDPAQVAVALAAKITFDTGLISGDTLLVRQEGVKKTIVEYRKAQLTGVSLDGSEVALRVPLPPLPNVFNSGSICWGSVQRVSDTALSGTSLAEDWSQLLGSSFGDHAVSGKSKSHPRDIRQKLIELEAKGAKRYPISDLIPAKKTLAEVLA